MFTFYCNAINHSRDVPHTFEILNKANKANCIMTQTKNVLADVAESRIRVLRCMS